MDRLQFQRSLVALCGLALVLASSGCRDRNLRVPPPAHYTDGEYAIPEATEAYPGYPPAGAEPSGMNPYGGADYGGADYGAPGSFDADANPTSGVYSGAADAMGAMPAASGANPYAAAPSEFGVPPVPGDADPTSLGAPYASSSSPSAYDADPSAAASAYDADPYASGDVSDPYAAINAMGGTPGLPVPDEIPVQSPYGEGNDLFPSLDSGSSAPPIPDSLPEMP